MTNAPKSASRRRCLQSALAACAAAALAARAWGAGKITKAAAQYVDHPVSGRMCGMCRFFMAHGATTPGAGMMGQGMMGQGMMGSGMGGMMKDGTCQLVEGEIRPMGYCNLYSALQK